MCLMRLFISDLFVLVSCVLISCYSLSLFFVCAHCFALFFLFVFFYVPSIVSILHGRNKVTQTILEVVHDPHASSRAGYF